MSCKSSEVRSWNCKKNQGEFVKHYMYAPGGNKVQKAISSFKVKVKVVDLDVMSFERALLVE